MAYLNLFSTIRSTHLTSFGNLVTHYTNTNEMLRSARELCSPAQSAVAVELPVAEATECSEIMKNKFFVISIKLCPNDQIIE